MFQLLLVKHYIESILILHEKMRSKSFHNYYYHNANLVNTFHKIINADLRSPIALLRITKNWNMVKIKYKKMSNSCQYLTQFYISSETPWKYILECKGAVSVFIKFLTSFLVLFATCFSCWIFLSQSNFTSNMMPFNYPREHQDDFCCTLVNFFLSEILKLY